MDRLDPNITRLIFNQLDDESLEKACSVNEYFNKKVCTEGFWFNRILNRFPLTGDEIREYSKKDSRGRTYPDRSYREYYLDLIRNIGLYTPTWHSGHGVYVPGKYTLDDMLTDGAEEGRLDLVKIAIRLGANVHGADDYALSATSSSGYVDIVKFLLENKADPRAYDNESIKSAAPPGHTEIVRLLLEHGADIHAEDDFALRHASQIGYEDTVRLLLENGADVHANTDQSLLYAVIEGRTNIVRLLLEYGATVREEAMMEVVNRGHEEIVLLLRDARNRVQN